MYFFIQLFYMTIIIFFILLLLFICVSKNSMEKMDHINSRCMIHNLKSCQNHCKNGCQYCGYKNYYRCEML